MKESNKGIKSIITTAAILIASCSTSRIPDYYVIKSTQKHGADCMYLSDTSSNSISIIFETQFKDSLKIFDKRNNMLWNKYISTIPSLGVCENQFDYVFHDKERKCELKLVYGHNDAIYISISKSISFIYVNQKNNYWSFEGANCLRQYK